MTGRSGWVIAAIVGLATAAPAASAQRAFRAAPPEATKVKTKDGVELSLTYYPSRSARDPALGKEVTPVVLLHDEKATQGMFSSLAARLQSPGPQDKHPSFAVVTVDLRGHGASVHQTAPNGATRQLDAAKLNRADIIAMSIEDMDAVRRLLVEKNDAGELNLNKLSLVGVGLGATVAVNWAARDWSFQPLLVGKQGQDVKVLVLISPQWKYRGVLLQQAMRLRPLKQSVAWLLIYGDQASGQSTDVKRIERQLERFHPEPVSTQGPPRRLAIVPFPSALEGSSLMSQVGAPVEDAIIDFLTVHVADEELPWSKRRNRLD